MIVRQGALSNIPWPILQVTLFAVAVAAASVAVHLDRAICVQRTIPFQAPMSSGVIILVYIHAHIHLDILVM